MKGKILTFNSRFLNEIFNGEIAGKFALNKASENFLALQEVLLENGLQNQFELKNLIETVKNGRHYGLFVSLLNSINLDVLYKSRTHGLFHIERTAFWASVLASLLKLNGQNFRLAVILAMYHDTGRVDDSEDRAHGKRSAQNLANLGLQLTEKELKIAQCVVEAHSINDSEFEDLLGKYGLKENKRIRTLFNVLKDADGLDRVRLRRLDINPKFLRTEFSKKCILAAFTLKQIYDTMEQE